MQEITIFKPLYALTHAPIKVAADQLADEKAKYLTLTELSADWDWELESDFWIREISK